MRLGHCMTALVTPFDQTEKIDKGALQKIIEKLLIEGCDGFIVCGTTGEASSLQLSEKIELLDFVLEVVKDRVCVWMGCGSNNTSETIVTIQRVATRKIDGILLVTPYYVRPSQAGLYAHYAACASVTSLPIMLYNVPKRTGVSIDAETVIQLAVDFGNIVALKQACHDLDTVHKILMETDQLQILSGEDDYFLEGLNAGMNGIVSVVGHCFMPWIVKIWEDFQYGVENIELDQKLKQASRFAFQCSSPSDIKAMLAWGNWCNETVRLPLVTVDEQHRQQIHRFMKDSIKN